MAPGTSSAADEVYGTTDEKANFQRLTRLLIRGGLSLLREVFDSIHPPANLPALLGNPAVKSKLQTLRGRVLTHPEWNCLYNPSGPGTYGKSTDFDISLLCKLLREICSLTPPPTGWKDLPNITDHSLGADLARIRIYRNKIYGYNHTMEVTDADFMKLWIEISEAFLRIAGGISSAKRDEWKISIEKFFHEPLTPDAKECVDELRLWYLVDMDTKDKLEKLYMKMEQMQMKNELEQRQMEILILLESKARGSVVSSSLREESVQSSFECLETPMSLPLDQSTVEGIAGLSTSAELLASQQNNPEVLDFWYIVNSFKSLPHRLFEYLKMKIGLDVQDQTGSSVIKVSSSSSKGHKALWKDYLTGHLNKVVQDTLVTKEVLEKLHLSEVKLKTVVQYSQSGKGKIFK